MNYCLHLLAYPYCHGRHSRNILKYLGEPKKSYDHTKEYAGIINRAHYTKQFYLLLLLPSVDSVVSMKWHKTLSV